MNRQIEMWKLSDTPDCVEYFACRYIYFIKSGSNINLTYFLYSSLTSGAGIYHLTSKKF